MGRSGVGRTRAALPVGRAPGPKAGEVEATYLGELYGIPLLSVREEQEAAARLLRARQALVEAVLSAPPHFAGALAIAVRRTRRPRTGVALQALQAALERAVARYRRRLEAHPEAPAPDGPLFRRIRSVLQQCGLRWVDLAPEVAAFHRHRRALLRLARRLRRARTAHARQAQAARLAAAQARFLLPPQALQRHSRRLGQLERAYRRARAALFVRNLRLVVYVAKRYRNSQVPFMDLVQEGNLGLLKAVERYDPTRGFRFSTYATWWIRQAISRAVAEKGRLVRIPVHMLEHLTRIERELGAWGGEEAVPGRVDGVDVRRCLARLSPPLSLDPGDPDEARGLGRVLEGKRTDREAEARLDQELLRRRLRRSLGLLKTRECQVLTWRYGLEGEVLTLEAIGRRLGISRERVRQIELRALRKLRRPERRQVLAPFLEAGVSA